MTQKIQRVIAGTLLGVLLVGAHWGGVTREVFAENTSSGGSQTSTGGTSTSTGGAGTSTGGMGDSTGNKADSTGGTGSSTGGTESSTGGKAPGGSGTSTTSRLDLEFTNPLKFKTIPSLVDLLLGEAWKIALPFAVAFYLYAGYLYLTAFSKPEKVSRANSILIYTSVGYGVIVLAHVIPILIEGVINGIGSML